MAGAQKWGQPEEMGGPWGRSVGRGALRGIRGLAFTLSETEIIKRFLEKL